MERWRMIRALAWGRSDVCRRPLRSRLLRNFAGRLGLELLALTFGGGALAQPIAQPITQTSGRLCPAQLGNSLEAIASESLGKQARWGALVQPLSTDASPPPLYAHNPRQYFTPASNVKLLTSAAALAQLGPDFRIRTSVYAVSPEERVQAAEGPVNLDAVNLDAVNLDAVNLDAVNLWVVGRGDPSLDSDGLQRLAQQIGQAGIARVNGLVVDESYLGDRFINPTWDWEDVQSGYGAPVNSLMLNQNAIGVRLFPQAVGQPLRLEWEQPELVRRWQVVNESVTVAPSEPEFVRVGRAWSAPVLRVQGQLRAGAALDRSAVAVTDPAGHFLHQFEQALAEAGVDVKQTLAQQTAPRDRVEVATHLSPPLAELLVATNANSQNLYAEALLRHVGRSVLQRGIGQNIDQNIDAEALWIAGLDQIEAVLTTLGVTGAYQLADGSGLSRRNLATPEAFVQTLQAMAQHPHAEVYRQSLAVMGERGTLRSRLRGTPVAGRFWGKSGGLSGVSSLSGYLYPPGYSPLVLSLLIDHSDQSGSVRRQTLDAMVAAVARLTPCPS
ncbi:MAG: D-alanyl-D-alanine carboxypeptidase/D-alanyl-D-alanine-endopeptidase [Elainellaceae cyanobacterium]